ncbi:MAG TPA: outer membrane beta-barrel protein, partial [Nevskiaceae bacterium]|nr:outer membrane beta-barrel protein [Nevskiaceae bacterium]
MSQNRTCGVCLAIALGALTTGVPAQEAEPSAKGDNAFADIGQRWYVSPMYAWTGADDEREVDDGDGFALAIGKNVNRHFNFELAGWETQYDAQDGGGSDGKIRALELVAYGFPWGQSQSFAGGLYGLAGLGWGDGKQFPDRPGLADQNKDRAIFDIGAGFLMRLPFVRFASLRLDARYRMDFTRRPFAQVDEDEDNDDPTFQEPVVSIGLLIPIGSVHEEPPPPAPVAVVPPAAICSDTQDNDGDGKTDFPADPGCTAADDSDETDPPPPPP